MPRGAIVTPVNPIARKSRTTRAEYPLTVVYVAATPMPHSDSSTITLDPAERFDSVDPSYFLVIEGGTSRIYPLPATGEVVIGRAPDADLRLSDASVSRRHTKIVVQLEEIVAVDLGSHNGTRVNGQRPVDARALSSGDVVTIGDVVLVLHRGRGAPTVIRPLDFSGLRQRLAEEIDRARTYHRPVGVLLFDASSAVFDQPRVGEALRGQLRPIDVWGFVMTTQLLVLLPDVDEDKLGTISRRMCEWLAPCAPSLRGGGVVCPTDASHVDTLLFLARRASECAKFGEVAIRPNLGIHRQIGAHDVLIADAAMLRVYDLVDKLAASSLPVLIHGETGTGKEIVAAALHEGSARRAHRLVTINCASMPESLVESELFGHERGAFTGATSAKVGLLEAARGGTVFLDEIGELLPSVQAKLLRVLETKRFTRLGDVNERAVDIRLVAATHRDLEADVAAGRFRRDLYFRLNAAVVRLPPLRHRQAEIPLLARMFLTHAAQALGKSPPKLSDRVMTQLCAHDWSGNLRELKHDMEYLAATVEGPTVEPWHLPPKFTGNVADEPMQRPNEHSAEKRFRPLEEELRDLEKQRMREALEATGGVQTRAADLLAMPRRTFFAKMKHYGLSPKSEK